MNRQILFGLLLGISSVIVLTGIYLWTISGSDEIPVPQKTATASFLRNLKEEWKVIIERDGGDVAYASFLEVAPLSRVDPHEQAHAFGEALYEVEGLKGLSSCDSSFEFGCYHSFFGIAVQEEGIEVLPQFDEACKKKYGDYNLPCQHGIGHGVLVYTDYEKLEEALELCETISTLPTGGCSSGVFMEYNFHTMDESTVGYVRDVKGDLYEPCNTIAERFQPSCYLEQVQWWQTIFNSDFKHIGNLCNVLPQASANYTACFNGIGNYVAAFTNKEYAPIIEQCALMPSEETKGLCHEGASWLIRFEEGKSDDAAMLCNVLQDPYRTSCTQKLQF